MATKYMKHLYAYIIERTLIPGRSKPKNSHSHELHQLMKRRPRFELDTPGRGLPYGMDGDAGRLA